MSRRAHGAVQFIAVGTPGNRDGTADVRPVLEVARTIGAMLQREALVVCKSTVPVGTTHHVQQVVQGERPQQWLTMTTRGAELTKYACNAMLAARVSLMNEFAQLAEALQVDIDDVRQGMASDPRIGALFLAPGCGFGGSCLPKDIRALQRIALDQGVALPTLAGAEQTNRRQKGLLARRAIELFGGTLAGRRIALWGLAFKPGTDDLREAPSEVLIGMLAAAGAEVVVHDPVAMPAARRLYGQQRGLAFAADPLGAVEQADALLIATDWREYQRADWAAVRARMAAPNVLDGRNVCDPARMATLGFAYRGIGRVQLANFAATSTAAAERTRAPATRHAGMKPTPSPINAISGM